MALLTVDVTLSNAKIPNIENLTIKKGEKFKLKAYTETPLDWFANRDEVLDLKVTDNKAIVEAKDTGVSLIKLMDGDRVAKTLTVEVVDDIVEEAETLEISTEAPVTK